MSPRHATSSIISAAASSTISASSTATSSAVILVFNCPSPLKSPPLEIVPLYGSVTFHDLSAIIAGVFAIIAILISIFLIVRHTTHFSKPAEQKHVIRVISLIIFFSMISWLAVWFEDAARFLTPLLSLYESYIFASFFLLLCTWISPDPTERHRYFNDLERKNKKGEIISGGSLQWFHTRWIAVMQFPAVSLIITIVVEITEAANVYCATSNSGKWAHIYCSIITALSTALAFTSVLQFYREVKVQLAPQKPLLKLVSIKGIVGLLFAQAIIFGFLTSGGELKPTNHLSYNDILYGIPSMVLCIEMVLFALFFLYVYPISPYRLVTSSSRTSRGYFTVENQRTQYCGGPLGIKAIFSAMNITDILGAMLYGPMKLATGPLGARQYDGTAIKPLNSRLFRENPGSGEHATAKNGVEVELNPPPRYMG